MQRIKNWLVMAFVEPVDRLNDSYYFDKLQNQFFSIFITDYFVTDIDQEVDIQSPYSENELKRLNDRINRIEAGDSSIIYVPRLTVAERKQMIKDFLEINTQFFDIEKAKSIIDNETGRNIFDLNEIGDVLKSEWETFKVANVLERAETFCNLNGINIESASLWTDKKAISMTINLIDPGDKILERETKPGKKVWWKFWQ